MLWRMPADLSPERIGIMFARFDGASPQSRIRVDFPAYIRPIYGAQVFPRSRPARQPGIDFQEGLADAAGEREVAREVAAVEIVEEDAAHAARLTAMRQMEV